MLWLVNVAIIREYTQRSCLVKYIYLSPNTTFMCMSCWRLYELKHVRITFIFICAREVIWNKFLSCVLPVTWKTCNIKFNSSCIYMQSDAVCKKYNSSEQ